MRKLTIKKEITEDALAKGGVYSFINFASIKCYYSEPRFDEISYFCDGMLASRFFSYLSRQVVKRVSFDFTSAAGMVFKYAINNGKNIYFVGAKDFEVTAFVSKIKSTYPQLPIVGYSDGYFNNEKGEKVIEDILKHDVHILILSLGAPKQEEFAIKVMSSGFQGTVFTCGGFIRQEANTSKRHYYPKIVDKMNLRFAYRMLKEPHTIRRYTLEYPYNIYKSIKFSRRHHIEVID